MPAPTVEKPAEEPVKEETGAKFEIKNEEAAAEPAREQAKEKAGVQGQVHVAAASAEEATGGELLQTVHVKESTLPDSGRRSCRRRPLRLEADAEATLGAEQMALTELERAEMLVEMRLAEAVLGRTAGLRHQAAATSGPRV